MKFSKKLLFSVTSALMILTGPALAKGGAGGFGGGGFGHGGGFAQGSFGGTNFGGSGRIASSYGRSFRGGANNDFGSDHHFGHRGDRLGFG